VKRTGLQITTQEEHAPCHSPGHVFFCKLQQNPQFVTNHDYNMKLNMICIKLHERIFKT